MAYCTQSDLEGLISDAEIIQLTDDDGAGQADSDTVARAIAGAESEINGWVGKRYAVPLDPVPPRVRDLAVDIAVYTLYSRRGRVPEDRQERYKNAVAFLKAVAEGKATLGEDTPEGTPAGTPVRLEGQTRLFDRDTMKGF